MFENPKSNGGEEMAHKIFILVWKSPSCLRGYKSDVGPGLREFGSQWLPLPLKTTKIRRKTL